MNTVTEMKLSHYNYEEKEIKCIFSAIMQAQQSDAFIFQYS